MSGRVWRCEMLVDREAGPRVWTPCTVTLFRTKPRLQLETDPYTKANFKTQLNVNQHLTVRYRDPISKDFTLHLEDSRERVTFAVFSEAEGNEVLLGLRKGSAKLSPQKGPIYNINQRKGTTHTIEVEQTLIKPPNKDVKKTSRRLSGASWLRNSTPSLMETAVWYCEDPGDSNTDAVSVTSTIRDFETDDEFEEEEDEMLADNSVTPPRLGFLSSSLPRLHKDDDTSPLLYDDATDGSFSSYFGTLPRATRKLFKSELYLSKSESQLNKERCKFVLPDNWRDDDVFDPGQFGLLDIPGVLRMDFDDYPDEVTGNKEEEGDSSSMDHFDYVKNRFPERDPPGYEVALIQNGLLGKARKIRFEGLEDDGEDSDNSTLKLSSSDEETEV